MDSLSIRTTSSNARCKYNSLELCLILHSFFKRKSILIKRSLSVYFQWVEESFTNFGKGINWRSYVVCDVAYNNVNNWLWSPFIDRGSANRLYIEIQFTIRDCSLFPGNALSCKETFSLLFYEFDAATREPPPWQPESYKLIGMDMFICELRFCQNSQMSDFVFCCSL